MLYQNLHVFTRSLRVIDGATLALSAMIPWWLQRPAGVWDDVLQQAALLFGGALVLGFTLVAGRLGIYHTRRTETLGRELLALFETALLALALATLMVELMLGGLPAAAYATVGLAGAGTLLGCRLSVRLALRRLRRSGRDYRAWLLVGRNARSAALARDILDHPHYGIRILGVMDAPSHGHRLDPARHFSEPPLDELPLIELDHSDAVREVLQHQAIDEVIVTLPLRSFYDEVDRLVRLCARGGVSVKLPAECFGVPEARSALERLGAMPFMTHYSGPVNGLRLATKRLIDLALAGLGLTLLSPMLGLAALAIKLDSAGPVFFRQARVGLNGRLFTMLKFRTMVDGADEQVDGLSHRSQVDGPVFKMRDDPRITRVGRWLRRYYFDELPQLINVLTGEMSLVGPRPPLPEELERYEWWQRRRLSMPPGMTCLWQVCDDHHSISFDHWMELDLQYIDGWSLGLDLRLLLATAGHVVKGAGW